MTVILISNHWATNARIQRAANNNPLMRQFDPDKVAVKLLQEALIATGFPSVGTADGIYGPKTAGAVVQVEKHFGFKVDPGFAGREVFGALDLALRGWKPAPGPHWGGQLAAVNLPVALRKVRAAITALEAIETMFAFGGFDFVTADGVTMAALKTHFKLTPPTLTPLPIEEPITKPNIDAILKNFRAILRTLTNPAMIKHTICTGGDGPRGLSTAAEAPFGGPVAFGPPFSDFAFGDPNVTNIERTGPNSLAAMMIHEATHVIDNQSGDDATTHISEFTVEYETQPAVHARHNPSAYATFAAHIDEQKDRERSERYGLGNGRPL